MKTSSRLFYQVDVNVNIPTYKTTIWFNFPGSEFTLKTSRWVDSARRVAGSFRKYSPLPINIQEDGLLNPVE
jgi:hypothetical protein